MRSFDEELLERVRAYRETGPYEKALRKRKVWVEPMFAEAKEWHGMRRFRLRTLWRVNVEALVIASGQNIKRLLDFSDRRPRRLAQAQALRPPAPTSSANGRLLPGNHRRRSTPLPTSFSTRCSLGRRSEKLFDALTKHWRHVGSIRLIAGPDLATTTVEPHEFLDFMGGRLARRFIDGPGTFDLRLTEEDDEPDRDGRFRVNDFFCYDDTWRMVLSRLAGESDAVLMDLRGFSPQNAGCIYEINELVNLVPLERVVFVVDDTTDEDFLRRTARECWERMRPTSPNRSSTPEQLRLLRLASSGGGELRRLLRALCAAARTKVLTPV
jgi:hypothetical protein